MQAVTTTLIILIVVFVVLLPLVGVGVGLALRGRVQRRLYSGTGLPEWTMEAKRLSWSDRIHLARANDRGQAARPELAGTAARRGRVMIATIERYSTLKSQRWLLRAGLVIVVLQLALNVWMLTRDDTSWINWATLVVWPLAIVLFATVPWQQRRQRRKLERSVDLNDALAAQQPDHSTPIN